MLGLERRTVKIVPYDSMWMEQYRLAEAEISGVTSHIELLIEHIGSTSVPGLAAKPIIDIGVLLRDPDSFTTLRSALSSIKWIYRGDRGSGHGGRLFVRERAPEVRTHHLHACLSSSSDWERYLEFRERLRKNSKLRDKYGSLKQLLAKRNDHDRIAYTEAKVEFVERVLFDRCWPVADSD